MNPIKYSVFVLAMLSLNVKSQCISQTDKFTKDVKIESGDFVKIGKFQGGSTSADGYGLKVKTYSLNGKMNLRFYAVFAGTVIIEPKEPMIIKFVADTVINVYPSYRSVSESEESRSGANWFDIINIKLNDNQIAMLEKYPIASIQLNYYKYELFHDKSIEILEQIKCVRTAK